MSTATSTAPSKGLIVLCYAIVYLVWGSTFFFIEKALVSFPPFILGSFRFLMASLLLFTFCGIKGYVLWDTKAVKEAAFVGFLLLFVDMAAIIWSEQYISSAIVSIISAACAIWFVVFDKPQWKKNFSSIPTIIGLVFGFIGVLLLFIEQLFTPSAHESDGNMKMIAMIVMLVGTIGWTIGSLYSKYQSNKEAEEIHQVETPDKEQLEPTEMPIMVRTAWQMLIASIAFIIASLIANEYATFDIMKVPAESWWHLGYLAVFGSIIAFSAYIYLLDVRPATEVSTYAYVNPIVAMVLAYFFTDHQVTSLQIGGLLIVLISVLLMNWEMYASSRAVTVLRNRRFRKYLYQKSSIPRIFDVIEISRLRDKFKKK